VRRKRRHPIVCQLDTEQVDELEKLVAELLDESWGCKWEDRAIIPFNDSFAAAVSNASSN
jgi:hypothetical protein